MFCNKPANARDANTITDHIEAFTKFSKHNVILYSCPGFIPPNLDLSVFDAVIIHYSSYLLNDYYIPALGKEKIAQFKGMKILFLQDEYRKVNQFHHIIKTLGIDILFTCLPTEEIEKIYPEEKLPGLIKVNNLTGYVPEALLQYPTPPIKNRRIDVGYRARKLPYWYGKLSVEKWKIVDDFLAHTKEDGLHTDLSYDENKRIYGKKWIAFVQSCKTMLGVESGASVIDYTGELEPLVERYQARHPNASFEEVYEKFLKEHDGKVYMNQISPRCFEAIALKTPMVLFEGRYSDILIPDRHYISLKKDFSNIKAVVAKIKDDAYLQHLADTAYCEIGLSPLHTYQNFIKKFDEIVDRGFMAKKFVQQLRVVPPSFVRDTFKSIPLKKRIQRNVVKFAYTVNRNMPTRLKLVTKSMALPVLKKLKVL